MCGLPNELIPIPTYPKQRGHKSATTYMLSTSSWVVERPDHHCGDDLVFLYQKRPEIETNGDLFEDVNYIDLVCSAIGIGS